MAMGIWLKETLREKGMTIKQLSELSGVSLNTLYSITKRDTERIDPVILRRIKKAIGLDKTELEPCPFCGGKANLVTHHNRACTWARYYVKCERCLVHQHNYETPQIAIEAWNRRTPA